MTDRSESYRRLTLFSGVLTLVVSIIVGAGIIPPVLGDTYVNANPEKAATAFGISTAFHVLVAAVLFVLRNRRSPQKIVMYIVVAVCVFVLGFALLDAGTSFQNHGPDMATAALLMLVGAAMDGMIAVMIVLAGVYRPRTEQ